MKALVAVLVSVAALAGCDRGPDAGSASLPSGAVGAALDDTVITARTKAAIAADAGMRDSDVSVATREGVVTLSGSVKSQDQVAIATNLAQRQEGVRRVENALSLR